MTEDLAKGLQEMFANAQPELLNAVGQLIETTHNFLYDSEGGSDNIENWNECMPEILAAMRTVPELQAWAKQLDDFKEAESAK